ncbi:MAG: hypothetical protein ACT4P5_20470, partial [Armatimonadota bacterium]
LAPVTEALARLRTVAVRFDEAVARDSTSAAGRAEMLARTQRAAIRTLVQTAYTDGSPFGHDPAVPQLPLPSLQGARDLIRLSADSHEARRLQVRLVRQRNKVVFALITSAEALEAALADIRGR